MGRLVAISNRAPAIGGGKDSGGLVVALGDALNANGGLWIGANPEPVEEPGEQLQIHHLDQFDVGLFDVTRSEIEGHYLGYSNSVIWPTFHSRTDLLDYSNQDMETYHALNRRVARQAAQLIEPGDMIWVHDYQLIPLARYLREIGVHNRIGFFLHIPVPPFQTFTAIPGWQELAYGFAAYDVVGLQTQRDVSHMIAIMQGALKGEITNGGNLRIGGHTMCLRSFPISIDVAGFKKMAEDAISSLEPAPAMQLIGVDRLDYSKGLVQRFEGYRHFLEHHADWQGKVRLLQISPPSRENLEAYQAMRQRLELLAGEISGEFASLGWSPIHYIHNAVDRDVLAGLMRQSRVGLVTPLFDGMNLVAKEYVAAQDPGDPGVLILSQFAGAAEQMKAALLVNPHDTPSLGRAIARALEMPLHERRKRHEVLYADLSRNDIKRWTNEFLETLRNNPAPARKTA